MALCVDEIRRLHGGIVVAYDGGVVGSIESVDAKLMCLHAVMGEMGCVLPSPFMTQSFLALPVIPRLKITDLGLVDVEKHEIVDVING